MRDPRSIEFSLVLDRRIDEIISSILKYGLCIILNGNAGVKSFVLNSGWFNKSSLYFWTWDELSKGKKIWSDIKDSN